jgi:hypothetical protein
LLRINRGGTFRPAASTHYQPLRALVPQPGTQWVGLGTAFQGPRRRLNCTLLARWDEGSADPWLLLTDLAPSAGAACWYGLRAWIEQGFKITKRGGWQWQRTRMSDPHRAARLWLAVAVATLGLLSVGGMAEETVPVSTLLPLASADCPSSRPRRATQLRLVGVFRQGWITLLEERSTVIRLLEPSVRLPSIFAGNRVDRIGTVRLRNSNATCLRITEIATTAYGSFMTTVWML